jgi:general secretion pathway protein G
MMKKIFTLIELLIVIAIIAILLGIALPRFRGMQEEGNIAKAKAELRTLQTAVESYYIHHNSTYPSSLSALTTTTPNLIGSSLPTDPFNKGNNYGYQVSGNGKYYVIYSVGPAGNGAASVDNNGTVTETNGESCIYVSNASRDTQP